MKGHFSEINGMETESIVGQMEHSTKVIFSMISNMVMDVSIFPMEKRSRYLARFYYVYENDYTRFCLWKSATTNLIISCFLTLCVLK